MPFNLTLSGDATFTTYPDGVGQGLTAGFGTTASNPFNGLTSLTVEGRFATAYTGLQVAVSCVDMFWFGQANDGTLTLKYNSTSGAEISLNTTVSITDGDLRAFAFTLATTGAQIFVDGVSVATSSTTWIPKAYGSNFQIGTLVSNGGFAWRQGYLDDIAVTSGVKYTSNYTPPSGFTGSEANLVTLHHLDGDGVDSKQVSLPTVAAPTFNPASGATIAVGGTVALSSATSGVTFHYQVDNGGVQTGSTITFPTAGTFNVAVFGSRSGYNDSAVSTATFTAQVATTVATPTINPSSGSVPSGQPLTMASATTDAVIRYTVDGTDPTSTSTIYNPSSKPVLTNNGSAAATVTVKAKGFKSGSTSSAITTVTLSVSPTTQPAQPVQIYADNAAFVYCAPMAKTGTGVTTRQRGISSGRLFDIDFRASSVKVKFDMTRFAACDIHIQVDGGSIYRAAIADVLTFPDTLATDWHTLRVWGDVRENTGSLFTAEGISGALPGDGGYCFMGLELAPGGAVRAPEAMDFMNVDGDSIGAGVRMLGTDGPNGENDQDSPHNWPEIVAQGLGLRPIVRCFGGTGIDKTGSGRVPGCLDRENWVFEGAPYTPPDNVVLNVTFMGTNDNGTEQSVYTALSSQYLAMKRARLPNAKLVDIAPQQVGGNIVGAIAAAVAAKNAAGDAEVYARDYSFSGANGDGTLWPGGAPTIYNADGIGHLNSAGALHVGAYMLSDLLALLDVTPPVPSIASVTIDPAGPLDLAAGSTQQFTGTVNGTGQFNSGKTWTKYSGVGGVSIAGLYTAPTSESTSDRSAVLKCASVVDPTKFALVTINIPGVPVTPPPSGSFLPTVLLGRGYVREVVRLTAGDGPLYLAFYADVALPEGATVNLLLRRDSDVYPFVGEVRFGVDGLLRALVDQVPEAGDYQVQWEVSGVAYPNGYPITLTVAPSLEATS